MTFETYTQFFDGEPEGMTVRPGEKSRDIFFEASPAANKRYRLFTVGETEQYYMWKDEPDGPVLYRMLSDALDTAHAIRDRYCLALGCKKEEDYLKRVYKKIPWEPRLSYLKMTPVPTEWEAGITVSANRLTFGQDGYLRMRVDVRLKREGVSPRSTVFAPDLRVVLDFPAGTYTGQTLRLPVSIPENTANVCVFVEGIGYKGECYVEQPFLSAIGHNLLPSFNEAVQDLTHMDWTAQYLSRKEWPEFRVRLNGRVIFTGEIFERCHRHSEWEIDLPKHLLKEKNSLSYELISDYRDPLPYTVYEIGLIEQPAAELSVIAVSEAAPAGGRARVLVRTDRSNLRVTLDCEGDGLSGKKEWFFREKGLHGMLLDCGAPQENALFRLSWENGSAEGCVKRIVCRGEDRVITGTGDMIYVCQDEKSMEEYLSWYLSAHVGDLLTIRPTYRWSGTRTLNETVWKKFRRLMRELDLKYVLMADGREVPGLSTQPERELLEGKGFLGIQLHERDNLHFYGGRREVRTLFAEQTCDLIHFAFQENPKRTGSHHLDTSVFYDGNTMLMGSDRRVLPDYALEHEKTLNSLRATRREQDTRHTGPACTFKYMMEAGYSWLGAETMYQTMEPLMGFLRGVAKNYKMPTCGAHHAVQWSTSPHESPARYRRYRLALYASYMQGATDINTEEGLWHLEEYYEHHHRFSPACVNHLRQQQDFYRYVTTHTRSGCIYSPVAFLHGRDDGVTFFGKDRTWGHRGEPQTAAEDSWDLLTAVYPHAVAVDRLYIHNCPEDRPVGFHSETPYGNIDVFPVEGQLKYMNGYRALVFMGYNNCKAEDAQKLLSYVKRGGRLLLTHAHLTDTTFTEDIRRGALSVKETALTMTEGEPSYREDTVNGVPVSVCSNPRKPQDVLAYTDSGAPLVCSYRIGRGEIVLFQTKEYPSQEAIRPLYEEQMLRIFSEENARETVWAESGDRTEFSVYDQEDGSRHVYFLAVDWYREPAEERHATLRLGTATYDVAMPFGVLIKCVCRDGIAAWAGSEEGEVLSVTDRSILVQGTGSVPFIIARNGKTERITVDFSQQSLQELPL